MVVAIIVVNKQNTLPSRSSHHKRTPYTPPPPPPPLLRLSDSPALCGVVGAWVSTLLPLSRLRLFFEGFRIYGHESCLLRSKPPMETMERENKKKTRFFGGKERA